MSAARGVRSLRAGRYGARLALASTSENPSIVHASRLALRPTRPDVGCSFWVTRSRWYASPAAPAGGPVREGQREDGDDQMHDDGVVLVEELWEEDDVDDVDAEDVWDDQRGVIVDQTSPRSNPQTLSQSLPSSASTSASNLPNRPRLPSSIKKLNKMLVAQKKMTILESELDEKFVRGSGPGGQAISKTSSSVSLVHLPTGIRVQSQPTRSREQNRKVARRILAERLELLRARGEWDPETKVYAPASATRKDAENAECESDGVKGRVGRGDAVGREMGETVGEDLIAGQGTRADGDGRLQEMARGDGKEAKSVKAVRSDKGNKSDKSDKSDNSDKTKLLADAAMWSRAEIKWEKERRRKLNRSKKTKRKARGREGEAESAGEGEGEQPDV